MKTTTYRGIYNGRVWYAQSAIVVKEEPDEVALAILVGAECAAPENYMNGKHGVDGYWDRWGDYLSDNRNMKKYSWRANRLLILMKPEEYYSTVLFWQEDVDQFVCYYVNFQLPFQRSAQGISSLDLELDLVIEPSFEWKWKDVDDYQDGIQRGVIKPEWADEIERAKMDVMEKLEKRAYPFNGQWLDWKPDPYWNPPKLRDDWDAVSVRQNLSEI